MLVNSINGNLDVIGYDILGKITGITTAINF